MSLAAGTRLGPYEAQSAIGAGGMGEVYRARDARLRRDVVIKILPEAFAADPDRIARFQREAELLAALNHPNVASVYGVEESRAPDSGHATFAIVLELVDGKVDFVKLPSAAYIYPRLSPDGGQLAVEIDNGSDANIWIYDLSGTSRLRRLTFGGRNRVPAWSAAETMMFRLMGSGSSVSSRPA